MSADVTGAKAIADLMMWFATYCTEPSSALHPLGPPRAGTPVVSKPDSADPDAVQAPGQPSSKPEKAKKDGRPARGLLAQVSALSSKPFSRDQETNAMLPPIWRPYRVPSAAMCSAVASNLPVPCSVLSPLHLQEVEPDQQ